MGRAVAVFIAYTVHSSLPYFIRYARVESPCTWIDIGLCFMCRRFEETRVSVPINILCTRRGGVGGRTRRFRYGSPPTPGTPRFSLDYSTSISFNGHRRVETQNAVHEYTRSSVFVVVSTCYVRARNSPPKCRFARFFGGEIQCCPCTVVVRDVWFTADRAAVVCLCVMQTGGPRVSRANINCQGDAASSVAGRFPRARPTLENCYGPRTTRYAVT